MFSLNRQPPPPHHHPHRHPGHHRHVGIPGVSSPFIRALLEARNVENVDQLILRYAPYLNDAWEKIKTLGLVNQETELSLLAIEEAKYILDNRAEAAVSIAQGTTVTILPLPPDLTDLFSAEFNGNVVSSDYELPHHLQYFSFRHIDQMLPDEIRQNFGAAQSVIFEGFFEDGNLYVRRSIVRLLQLLEQAEKQLSIFVHPLPHCPPHVTDTVVFESKFDLRII
jgi:hypothetical protein